MSHGIDRHAGSFSHFREGLKNPAHISILVAINLAQVRADRINYDQDHITDLSNFLLQ
jgi:hypothetical protein